MKLAISNIAWPSGANDRVAPELGKLGITGIEIAPTALWPDPVGSSAAARKQVRSEWERQGFRIVALQALLYGHPELELFRTAEARATTLDYLNQMIALARDLGANAMVFGSPKNRARGSTPAAEADAIAIDFFRAIGETASDMGVKFCIEPNPPSYGCDYLTTTSEVVRLLEQIAHPAVGINLDAGTIAINREDPAEAVRIAAPWLYHFHVSEPGLAPITAEPTHRLLGTALREAGYTGWRSIEMRAATDDADPLEFLRSSVAVAHAAYS